jgi:hypothetical protein
MLKFFAVFIALITSLFFFQLTPWGQQYFVVPWTTALAHFVLGWCSVGATSMRLEREQQLRTSEDSEK